MLMILVKSRMLQKRLTEILKAVVENLAAAGELLVTGRVIKANDSKAGKGEPKT